MAEGLSKAKRKREVHLQRGHSLDKETLESLHFCIK